MFLFFLFLLFFLLRLRFFPARFRGLTFPEWEGLGSGGNLVIAGGFFVMSGKLTLPSRGISASGVSGWFIEGGGLIVAGDSVGEASVVVDTK